VNVPIQVIDNIVLVPLTLNRSQGATFLLDTGAQFTVLTPELAARIGLDVPADAPTRTLLVPGSSAARRVDVMALPETHATPREATAAVAMVRRPA
jgi:predicted aspartyl protease